MNRKEEYADFLTQLDNTPPALEYTIARATARVKRAKRVRRFFTIPVSSIAAFFIAFVVMVNASPTFAMACEKIPLLRELAAAVAFSPSLSAAVENEYVQPVELEQSENGITMRVEYIIVDRKQLNIFYYFESQSYSNIEVTEASIMYTNGKEVGNHSIFYGNREAKNGELRYFTVDFVEGYMPKSLVLNCKVDDGGKDTATTPVEVEDELLNPCSYREPDYISSFTFTLDFDPTYMWQGGLIILNQNFILDGQHLTATMVEIYPTHMRLNLTGDENNSAWLESLGCYFENEQGKRFEAINNGITAIGSMNSPMMSSYGFESSFFSESESLTLYITDAVWLDKATERVKVDLANGTADVLPEGMTLEQSVRKGNSWKLTFSALEREEDSSYQLFGNKYFDEDGNEYEYNHWTSGGSDYLDEKTGEDVEGPGAFVTQFALIDYPYDTVYLSPCYSRSVHFESPIAVKVK